MSGLRFSCDFKSSELRSLPLPVEIRKPNLALVARTLTSGSVELQPGTYHVTAKLPTGGELCNWITVVDGMDNVVVLTPDSEDASPEESLEIKHFIRGQRDALVSSEEFLEGLGWEDVTAKIRLFGGNFFEGPESTRRSIDKLSSPVTSSRIGASFDISHADSGLVQLLQSQEVPINVALPVSPQSGCQVSIALSSHGRISVDVHLENVMTDALLKYYEKGLLEEAGAVTQSPELTNDMESLKVERLSAQQIRDPIGATVGAYTLLRLGDFERLHGWTRNLKNWFGWLPDGIIIRAEHLARLGEHQQALQTLLELPGRGLPIFSDGLSYAIGRLRTYLHLRDSPFEQEELLPARDLLKRLQGYAAFVDFRKSILTFTGLDPCKPDKKPVGKMIKSLEGFDIAQVLGKVSLSQRLKALKRRIRERFLPPLSIWPEYLVPAEFADTPMSLNLADFLLDRHVREGRGDNPAIKFMDRTITYGQLQRVVNKFGNALREAGVKPQDRVGLRLVNSPQAIVTVLAIEKIGAIPVPTSPLWSKEEVAFVVNDSEMRCFIVNAPLMGPVGQAKTDFEYDTKIIVVGGDPNVVKASGDLLFEEMLKEGSPDLDAVMLDHDHISVILYTSGTTGMPKGCVHFIRPTVIEAKLVNKWVYKLHAGDVLGGVAPVSFGAGFGTFTLFPFEGGAAISLNPRFAPADMLDLIQKHKITVFTGPPAAYRALMKYPEIQRYDISSVRLFTCGGDPLGSETLREWKRVSGKPIWEGLWDTEMLHLVTSNTINSKPAPDSIGKALPGLQVRVVDYAGKDCKPNEIGNMIVKGPTGILYWKPYKDDEHLLQSQRKAVIKGWNQTGDVVFMREDGNISFISSEDDMIISSGYRIGPAEVEKAIEQHPAVAEAGVVGIPDPDKGQIAKAFVVLKEGHEATHDFFEELRGFLKKHIAIYKLPRAIEYVDLLPRTPTGRLLRRQLPGGRRMIPKGET